MTVLQSIVGLLAVSGFPISPLGLYTWGANNAGQLGIGNLVGKSSPVQVGSLTNWSIISTNAGYASSIKTDGTLWTWGANFYGQLGIGNIVGKSSPVQVGSLTNWTQVYGGASYCFAVLG